MSRVPPTGSSARAMLRPCSAQVEDVFGPIIRHCGSNFDFTLLFEETILFIGPICLTLVLATIRFWQLIPRRAVVPCGLLYSAKATTYAILLMAQAVLLATTVALDAPRTRATIAAESLGIAGFLFLVPLSYLEHCRAPQPSTLLSVYFLSQLAMNAVRVRTMWNMPGNLIPTIVFIAFSAALGLACILELWSKRSLLVDARSEWTPEQTCSILERAFSTWMIPLFRRGYRAKIEQKDLTPVDPKLYSDRLEAAHATAKNVSRSLLWEILRTHGSGFLQPVLPRLLFGALTFAQAFLVQSATSYIGQPVSKNTKNYGYGLIIAYILVYIGIAVTNNIYLQTVARVTTTVRAGLVSQIYRRSLELEIGSSSHGANTTLMSTDVDRVQLGLRRMHDIWSNFASAAIALWLVYTQLGIAMMASLALTIVCILGNFVLSEFGSRYQKLWLGAIEERISMFTQVLSSIKGVKITGCAAAVRKMIIGARAKEIRVSQKFRGFLIFSFVLSYCSLPLSPAFGISVHVAIKDRGAGPLLTASEAYTALTLYTIVSASLVQGLLAAFQFTTAVGCLQRIQKFLTQHARVDQRESPLQLCTNDSTEGSTTSGEKGDILSPGTDTGEKSVEVVAQAQDLYAKWDAESDWVLRNVNFCVARGEVTIVAGPTGCGKSTLLKALLGEVRHIAGSIRVDEPRISYCDQTPWLPNASIRENILGPSPVDESRYQAAIRTCALVQDISELQEGDKSLCGTGGLALSGGQKARIALARAIYAAYPLIILDGCFSGLDADTERHILAELFGHAGIFRRTTFTVILSTNSAKHLKWADTIVLLNQDGNILRQGSREEVMNAHTELQGIELLEDQSGHATDPPRASSQQGAPNSDSILNVKSSPAPVDGRFGSLELYRRTSEAAGGWINVTVFVLLVTCYVAEIYLRSWSERNPHDQRNTLTQLLGVYLGSSLAAWVACNIACFFFINRILPAMSAAFHTQLLDATLDATMGFFTTTDSGKIINRFSQDLSVIDRDVPFGIIGFVVTFIQLIAQVVVVIVGSNWSGIAVPALLVCIFVIQQAYLRTSKRLRLLDLEAKAPLFTQFYESLSGLATIRAFDWNTHYVRSGIAAMQRSQPPFYLLWTAQNTLIMVLNLVNALLAITIISVATSTHTTNGGNLGLALFTVVGLGSNLRELILNWTNLEVALGAVARVCDFTIDTPSENYGGRQVPPEGWPYEGCIDFKNVQVTYSALLPPVIPNLTLHIAPKSKVGICGRTGSGKSTLLATLLRLVDLQAGSLVVDGLSLEDFDKNAVRSRFIVGPQDPLILPGTLRENANIHTTHHDEAIIAALQKFGVWEIFNDKDGLDTHLNDDLLSQGQRQTLTFALSTLQKGNLVVLDEPASQIDTDLQEQMHHAIMNDFKDCTVLCVTHRLEMVLDFDAVVVMDQGKVIEFDAPGKLLTRPEGSMFARLYEYESRGLRQ